MKVDFLIVGQGLAGSLLAWHLLERQQKVLVVDLDQPNTSSKVAAGLVTPIAGQQLSLPADSDQHIRFAKKTYWEIEESFGTQLFHHSHIARLFHNQKQVDKWAKRLASEHAERFKAHSSPLEIDPQLVHAEHGGITLTKGGWLNVPYFLQTMQTHLLERLAYAIGNVQPDALTIQANTVTWRNIEAKKIIFCQGWQACQNHLFDFIPMENARGDILQIDCPQLIDESRIINRNGWLLPMGNGLFKAGSTFDHDYHDAAPTTAGRTAVEEKINHITPCDFSVIDHRSAIRPVINRSTPCIGIHPNHPQIAYFNGLGSKGVTYGPSASLQLVNHLLDQQPIADQWSINRLIA